MPVLRSVRPASWRLLLLRLLHLNLGLMLFGVSMGLMLRAGIGVGPWTVFHEGLALRTPLSFGQGLQLVGLAVLLFSYAVTKERPGIATVLNMALVGPWVDLALSLPGFPRASGWADGLALFMAGALVNGLATGTYITAGLGAGPRDGFVLGLARIAKRPIAAVRTVVELVVLAIGWWLGGSVGVGTVLFALTAGPLMQAGLRLFRGVERWHRAALERLLAHRSAEANTAAPAE